MYITYCLLYLPYHLIIEIKLFLFLLLFLRHSNLIKRRKLLLHANFNFLKAVLVQSNHIGAQYNVEQYVLNK